MELKIKVHSAFYLGIVILCALIATCMYGCPRYAVYEQNLKGQAELARQEWAKKIIVEEAKAKKASAALSAEAEIERAKGVAAANKIIGDSLQDNDEYLRYLWIQGLNDGSGEIIYVPTEPNLPILEATRGKDK
jgi:regulator of protease activity HflC (stomatin/prohibitin superfamily)